MRPGLELRRVRRVARPLLRLGRQILEVSQEQASKMRRLIAYEAVLL